MGNIAIDGPAGAGKSTIAKIVAKKKGYIYVDTGAMYRAMALFIIREGIKPEETDKIEEACDKADISIKYVDGEQVVTLNGESVNGLIRTEEVSNMASVTSVNAKVREKLVALQQKLGKETDVVMDGRDIGTVVLKDAPCKIYLTASDDVRAKRRYDELAAKGVETTFEEVLADLNTRDYNDSHRKEAPLKQADDAILLDTSELSFEEAVESVIRLVKDR